MRIERYGAKRNCGVMVIADEELTDSVTECSEYGVASTLSNHKDGNSTYNYKIMLSWDDIRSILHESLPE